MLWEKSQRVDMWWRRLAGGDGGGSGGGIEWAEGGGRAVVEARLRLPRGGGEQVDRQARVDRDVVGREGRRESRMGLLGGVRCV